MNESTKTCIKCKKTKSLGDFYSGNYNYKCKVCHSIYSREYREKNKSKIRKIKKEYALKSKDKIIEYRKEWRRKNIERIRIRDKKYNEKNKEKLIGYRKKRYEENKEKIRESNKKWSNDNKNLMNQYKQAHKRRRRALSNKIKENYTLEDEKHTKELFENKCFNCSSTKNLCIDHNYPISKGFPLTRTNAVLLCRSCNSSKSAKLPEEFYSNPKLEQLVNLLIVQELE